MTLHLQATPAGRDESENAMEEHENLALVLGRNPVVTEAAARILKRLPGHHVQVVRETLDALSPETLGALALAEVLVFEADGAALSQGDAVAGLLAHRGPTTRIIAVTAADLPLSMARHLMKIGIDEVVPAEADTAEFEESLTSALTTILDRRGRGSATTGGPQGTQGKVIAVANARGGLGATTIAVNLADMLLDPHGLLRKTPSHRVALIDLDVQFGNAATFVDLEDRGALIELARASDPPDGAFLEYALQRHESGLRVLPAPVAAMPLEALDMIRVGALIDTLRESYDYVVIDLPHALVSWLEAVITRTDMLLMVTDTSVPSVRSARRLINLLSEENPALATEIVINRESKPLVQSHSHKLAAEALRLPLRHFIAADVNAARRAIDRGEVMSTVAPNSSMTKSLRRLAGYVLKTFPAPASAAQSQGSN